jgi:hypothetical protein
MFGIGPIELILAAALSIGLIVFGGVCTLVLISKRGGNRPARKDS